MRTLKFVSLGILLGVVAELLSLSASFFGTNLFHGGHPRIIANLLLPGIAMLDHLAGDVPRAIPGILLVMSLLQFPLYGALAGREFARGTLSRISMGVILLHFSGSALAFYGLALDHRWQVASETYGACIRGHAAAQDLAENSSRIAALVKWIDQSRKDLVRLRTEQIGGVVRTPDPAPAIRQNLESQQAELAQRWQTYRAGGGTADSPEHVITLPGPCGTPPVRTVLFSSARDS